MSVRGPIYTLGHSNHPIARFVELLAPHGVEVVVDVRSQPYSRFHPQYRRANLEAHLDTARIHYVFLGRELGARSDDDACYVDGKVDYGRLAATAAFREGLAKVADFAREQRVALVCAERDPLECHRTILVAHALAAHGFSAQHIHADGHVESQREADARLVEEELGEARSDLFRDDAAARRDAYARRARKIAFSRRRE